MPYRSTSASATCSERSPGVDPGVLHGGDGQSIEVLAAVLDAFAAAVCVTDANRTLRAANLAARQWFAQRREPFVEHHSVSCTDPRSRLRLVRAVQQACAPEAAEDSFQIGAPPVRSVQVMVRALHMPAGDGRAAEPLALVIFGRSSTEHCAAERLRALFGLSRAEAGLMRELLTGKRLKECAESRGTTLATARTQLKAIFTKSGTSSQGQLVAIGKSLPATVSSPARLPASPANGLGRSGAQLRAGYESSQESRTARIAPTIEGRADRGKPTVAF